MQHIVSEGAKIKQNVNLFLYLTKKFQYPTTPPTRSCVEQIYQRWGDKENSLCKNDHQNHKKGEIHCSEVILEQLS